MLYRHLQIEPTAWVLAALILAVEASSAQTAARPGSEDQSHPCGVIYGRGYGPYDYRTHRGALKIAEDFHFKPYMEAGIRGDNGPVAAEITYILVASPNHARALVAMNRLADRIGSDTVQGMSWPMECYYERALRFRSDDAIVRMLYAQFLHKRQRTPEGLAQLDAAVKLAGDNAFTHYNTGLLYLELGSPDKALQQAHAAAAMGFPKQELAEQLKRTNRWRDPPAPGGAAPDVPRGDAAAGATGAASSAAR